MIAKLLIIGLIGVSALIGVDSGLMPEVLVAAPRPDYQEIGIMPEVIVTAPRYDKNENMMPEVVVTAPRPEMHPVRNYEESTGKDYYNRNEKSYRISNGAHTGIAMATGSPIIDERLSINKIEYDNTIEDLATSYKAFKENLYNYKSKDMPKDLGFTIATVQINAEKYKKVKGKLIIEKGDTVKEDIHFSGGQALIDGVLDGDFSVKGGTVDVNGMIDGDVSVFGGTMNVFGKVKGDVAVFGGDILNKGTINGDVLVTGGNIKLDSGSVVTGDIAIIGGVIEKDTNATVKGDIKTVSNKMLNKALPKIRGALKLPEFFPKALAVSARALVLLFSLGGFFVLTLLVILIFPRSVEKIAEKTQKNVWIPIAIGVGIQILIIPLIVLLAVSIIGIPVIPLFLLALFACLVVGFTSIYYLIGVRIKHTTDGKQGVIAKFALGFIVIMAIPILGVLIRIISPVGGIFTVLGIVIIYVVATIGLGAAFYTLVTRKKE